MDITDNLYMAILVPQWQTVHLQLVLTACATSAMSSAANRDHSLEISMRESDRWNYIHHTQITLIPKEGKHNHQNVFKIPLHTVGTS